MGIYAKEEYIKSGYSLQDAESRLIGLQTTLESMSSSQNRSSGEPSTSVAAVGFGGGGGYRGGRGGGGGGGGGRGWRGGRHGSGGRGKEHKQCHRCEEYGHFARECPLPPAGGGAGGGGGGGDGQGRGRGRGGDGGRGRGRGGAHVGRDGGDRRMWAISVPEVHTASSAASSSGRVDETAWVMDTGSPMNVSPLREYMFDFRPSSIQLQGFNGAKSTSIGVGSMILHVLGADGETNYLRLNDVQCVPEADCNLISREAMLAAGAEWDRTYRAVGSEEHYFDCDSDVAFMIAESRSDKLWVRVVGVGAPPADVGGDVSGVFTTGPANGAAGPSSGASSADQPSQEDSNGASSSSSSVAQQLQEIVEKAGGLGGIEHLDSADQLRLAALVRTLRLPVADAKPKNILLEEPEQLSQEQMRLRLSAGRWHRRYGHLSYGALAKLARSGNVAGMDVPAEVFDQLAREEQCDTCELTKQVGMSYQSTGSRAAAPLDLIHTDIWQGDRKTRGGHLYVLTVLDDYSKFAGVVLMKHKSDAPVELANVIREWQRQLGRTVKEVQSDRGREYMSEGMQAFFKEQGIVHLTSAPYTPQQNGAAERVQQTLARTARAMLSDVDLHTDLWGEALLTACTIRNRSPITGDSKTPFELFTGQRPSLALMRVFGCPAYVNVAGKEKPGKLAPNRRKGVFIGWDRGTVGYRVLMPDSKILVSRDVRFDERPSWWQDEARKAQSEVIARFLRMWDDDTYEDGRVRGKPGEGESASGPPATHASDEQQADAGEQQADAGELHDVGEQQADAGELHDAGEQHSGRSRPTRNRRPPERFEPGIGYVCAVGTGQIEPPKTVAEALDGPDGEAWAVAIQRELDSLKKNGTWVLAVPPAGVKPIQCRWVLSYKYGPKGEVIRPKARLVAKGFQQVEGFDYNDVFAPTAKQVTLRLLQAIVAKEGLVMHQVDVETAFLNADLEEDVWMEPPPGVGMDPDLKCHLLRAIYGLKQASRVWHSKLKSVLLESGFTASTADPGFFVRHGVEGPTYVFVHVDDMLIAGKSVEVVTEVKDALWAHFKLDDRGEASYFLGMEITRSEGKVKLSQRKYTLDIVERFGMGDASSKATPMAPNTRLLRGKEGSAFANPTEYRALVGALMYLSAGTRPDITYAVRSLARFFESPTQEHWNAAKHVVRYLKGTAEYGLEYGGSSGFEGWSDADYAGDLDTRRSTTGFVIKMHGGAVCWESKLQPTVALSTVYMAASAATHELIWLRKLMSDMGLPEAAAELVMMTDNQGALSLIKNPVISARSKHIDVIHHFVRERAEKKEVMFEFCPTAEMAADVLTKALERVKFEKFRAMMGVRI